MNSRTEIRYPASPERELMRVNRAYMRIFREALQKYLPEIIDAYKEGQKESREDALFQMPEGVRRAMQSVTGKVRSAMQKVAADVEQRIYKFKLDRRIEQIANQTHLTAIEEWRRSVKSTLGVDIQQDYYTSGNYSDTLKKWASDSMLRIKSLPNETVQKLEMTVLDGFREGKTIDELRGDIQSSFDLDKRKAEAIARDQVSTLNAQITRMQQTDAGVKKYRWRSCHDSAVRPCHAALDGKVFSWDNPPEMWYETKTRGRVYTGRHCHPGEDHGCRCTAVPVFEYDSVDIPIENE